MSTENASQDSASHPMKSSSEILSELFGAFNAAPPQFPADTTKTSGKSIGSSDEKSETKGKKHKKKFKHKKRKKTRKKKRSDSDDSDSAESVVSKKHQKKHKKDRKKHKTDSSDSVTVEKSSKTSSVNSIIKHLKTEPSDDKTAVAPGAKDVSISQKNPVGLSEVKELDSRNVQSTLDNIFNNVQIIVSSKSSKNSSEHVSKTLEKSSETKLSRTVKQEPLEKTDSSKKKAPSNSKKKETTSKEATSNNSTSDIFENDKTSELRPVPDKPKAAPGKIIIKNLKFSSVYETTVREVEEQAKKEAERYEDGEIHSSSESELQLSELSEGEKELLDLTPPPKDDQSKVSKSKHSSETRSRKHEKKHKTSKESKKRKRSHSESRRSVSPLKHRKERKTRSRSRSRSRSKSRLKYCSDSRDSKDKSHSRHNNHDKSIRRSHSNFSYSNEERNGLGRRSSDRSTHRSHGHSESRSRSHLISDHKHEGSSHRSPEKLRRELPEKIDKKKLLEIARKNTISMLRQGALPEAVLEKSRLSTIKAGGKTVDELTDFCKLLSQKDADGHESISSETDSGGESEKPFHHPFQIKDKPSSIVLNIKGAQSLPLKSFQEKTAESAKKLSAQFPVSSGQQHRKTEDWIPVEKKDTEATPAPSAPLPVQAPPAQAPPAQVPPVPVPPIPAIEAAPVCVPPPVPDRTKMLVPHSFVSVPPPKPYVAPMLQKPAPPVKDIGSIVTQRLMAMRKLVENPNDVEALSSMYCAQQDMRHWAESKQAPGQFTGSTGVRVLSVAELSSGTQAWVKKDMLTSAKPVSGGMGMTLLQKMGWKPGEGLGKDKKGSLTPLSLEVKMDKKGLVSQEDYPRPPPRPNQTRAAPPFRSNAKSLEGKHPVSLLTEFCLKRRISPPDFELCNETGPDHKKNFLYKVKVKGVEYKPGVASPNKKLARKEAAQACLRALGVLPPE